MFCFRVGDRTTEYDFYSSKNQWVGAQTKFFDEKILVEGDTPTPGARSSKDGPCYHLRHCESYDEIEFILELYNARKYVRFALSENIDNELHLKRKFNLL